MDKYLIENVYNIYSSNDAINYINNNTEIHYNTKIRIIEAITHIYIDTVVNDVIINEIVSIINIKYNIKTDFNTIKNIILKIKSTSVKNDIMLIKEIVKELQK